MAFERTRAHARARQACLYTVCTFIDNQCLSGFWLARNLNCGVLFRNRTKFAVKTACMHAWKSDWGACNYKFRSTTNFLY